MKAGDFKLDPSTIHVWQVNINLTDEEYQQLKEFLNPEEQKRLQQYTHEQARQQFLVVRGRLKQLLSGYTETAPYAIQFELGEYGKPRLVGSKIDDGLVFNISHSGSMALIAISNNCSLGVDVEKITNTHNLQGMAQRCFSHQELTTWNQLAEPCKTNQFFAYWCAKEAFLKATGRGLALGMQHCIVDLDQTCFIGLPKSYQTSDWQLQRIEVGENYCAFVAGSNDFCSVINKQFMHY